MASPSKGDTDSINLVHQYHDEEGVRGAQYTAKLSNGEVRTGTLDASGKATIAGVPPGTTAEVTYSPAEFAYKPKGATPNPTHGTTTGDAQVAKLVDKYAADMLAKQKN